MKQNESGLPSQPAFNFLRKIRAGFASGWTTARLADRISSTEILILAASFKMLTSEDAKKDDREASNLGRYGNLDVWNKYIVKETGLRFPELIINPEKQLADKNLISSTFPKNSGLFPRGEFYRLTSLGHHVCTFIGDYAPKD